MIIVAIIIVLNYDDDYSAVIRRLIHIPHLFLFS